MTSLPETRSSVRRVDASGVSIAVTEYAGTGPDLLLVHGLGTRAVSWWPVIDALARRFRVLAIDLRGHGDSDRPVAGYLVEDYAADLTGVIDGMKLRRPRVLAHSLGALVTLHWATTHPDRAAAIVVEDPPLRTLPNTLEAFDGWIALSSMTVDEASAYYRREYPDWTDEDCRRRAWSITGTAAGVFRELRADAAERLARQDDRFARLGVIQSPLMVVYGELASGAMTVPDDVARLQTILPGVAARYIAGAPHDLHRDATVPFLSAVIPFLDDPSPVPHARQDSGSGSPHGTDERVC